MDIKIVDENNQEIKSESTTVEHPKAEVKTNPLPELQHNAVAQVMGLDDATEINRYKDKVDILLEYAKSQTEDHSLENLKWVIRSLELSLGSPPLSEKRINYVARFAYLKMENNKIKKEMETMIKAGI